MIDPVLVEIVQGTLASIEAEVEEAIGRTARSPMIRDQHDFRAGIHDRRLRKLTGRSYSALVHPVVRDFPLADMRPGDVYFHNDVYLSEGGIGHLPDLCVTVPVFDGGEVVAFVQAFGHHDDIGGMVPGSMPSDATTAYQEGLMVPPVKLYDAGVPNDGVLRIVARNSRMPESLAGDIDAEVAATRMGARRLEELFARYGREAVEACFDATLTEHHGDVPPRGAGEGPGRHLRVGGLRRARRRRPAAAAPPAHHAHQARRTARDRLRRHRPAGPRPHQPRGRLRRRELPQEVARPDPAQPRRHARTGWPSSTSTRAWWS